MNKTVNHIIIFTSLIFAIIVIALMIISKNNQPPEEILKTNFFVISRTYDSILKPAKKGNFWSCSLDWERKEERFYTYSMEIQNDIIRFNKSNDNREVYVIKKQQNYSFNIPELGPKSGKSTNQNFVKSLSLSRLIQNDFADPTIMKEPLSSCHNNYKSLHYRPLIPPLLVTLKSAML